MSTTLPLIHTFWCTPPIFGLTANWLKLSFIPSPRDVAGELLVCGREALWVVDAEVEEGRRGQRVQHLGHERQRRQQAKGHAAPAHDLMQS